jgi:hypothetical protein
MSGSDDRRIDEILGQITKISEILKGDEYNQGGLSGRINDHEVRMNVLEKFKDRSIFIMGTLVIPAIPGVITLYNLISTWVHPVVIK